MGQNIGTENKFDVSLKLDVHSIFFLMFIQ